MNWAQFKDPHCYLCLHGAVLACWFSTQKIGGLNTAFLQKKILQILLILYNSFRENSKIAIFVFFFVKTASEDVSVLIGAFKQQ